MAFNLGDILLTIKANTDSLKKGLSDVQDMGDQTKTLGSKIQSGLNKAAVGLAVVGAGLTAYAKNATDYTVQAVKDAKSLGTTIGTTTTEASRLSAAVQHLGISEQDANSMFGIFSKQIVAQTQNTTANTLAQQKLQIQIDETKQSIKDTSDEITKNGDKTGALKLKLADLNNTLATQQNALKATSSSFDKLGISTVDATGKQKDFSTILFEVSDKIKAMPDGVDKTTIAMDLFGRSGKDMIKVLNLGSAGIQDLEKQADKLGLTLTAQTIGSVNELVSSQKELKQQTDAMKIAVGTITTPVLTQYNMWLNNVLSTIMNINPQMKELTANVLAFGGPVASAGSAIAGFLGNISSVGPKLAKFLLIFSGWAIVIAVVAGALYELQVRFGIFDDLGGKIQSVWNKLNSLYGLTTIFSQFWTQVMLPALKAIWAALAQNLVPAVEQLWDAFVRLWNALNPGLVDVLKVLAVLIGATLFAAIWLALTALNIIIQAFSMFVSGISLAIDWISDLISWLGNLGGAIWNGLKAFVDFLKQVPKAFEDVGSLLYDAGKQLVQGFINGIKDMLGAVGDAIKSVGSGAVNKMKGLLGIHSPSKVFAEIGGNVGAGLVKGIVNSAADVRDAMNTMLQPTGISSIPNVALSGSAALGASQGSSSSNPATTGPSSSNDPQKTASVYNIDISGVFARTDTELADMMERGIKALDRKRGAAGQTQILGASA